MCFNLSVIQCPVSKVWREDSNSDINEILYTLYFALCLQSLVCLSWSEHIFWTRPCRCSTDPPSPEPSPSSLDPCSSIPFRHSCSLAVANTRSILACSLSLWGHLPCWGGLPRWLSGKESACQCRRHGFESWVGKIPWRREWQATLVLLPGESHGQRSPVGCSPWGGRVRHDWAHTYAPAWLRRATGGTYTLQIGCPWPWLAIFSQSPLPFPLATKDLSSRET